MDPLLMVYPLSELGVSVRLLNCLKSRGYRTVGEVVGRDVTEFMTIPNFGRACLAELQTALNRLSLGLGETPFGKIVWARLHNHPLLQHLSEQERWQLYRDLIGPEWTS